MDKNARSEEQILRAMQQAESGARIGDLLRSRVSEATFSVWKNRHSGLALSQPRRRRSMWEENGKLKRLIADLSLQDRPKNL